MKNTLLITAIQKAKNGLALHPELAYFPHWTFIVQNNKVLSIGRNRSGATHKHFGYDKDKNNKIGYYVPKYHSEADAIRRCRFTLNNGFEAINIRLNRLGELKLSYPCKTCYSLLHWLGCGKIYFSTESAWGDIRL